MDALQSQRKHENRSHNKQSEVEFASIEAQSSCSAASTRVVESSDSEGGLGSCVKTSDQDSANLTGRSNSDADAKCWKEALMSPQSLASQENTVDMHGVPYVTILPSRERLLEVNRNQIPRK